MRRLIGLLMFAVCSCVAERMNFDEGWKFKLGDGAGAEEVDFNDSDWRTLDVPHDWSIEGKYDRKNPMGGTGGYLPAGIGWYRKTVPVSRVWKGKHVEIAFDGVYMNSTVWVNGEKLGTRPYGWSSFAYDISDAVQHSDAVTIAVRVDNEKQPSARWYTGSGIYAHTWLDVQEKVHIPSSGIVVRTAGSSVELDAEIRNTTGTMQKIDVEVSIVDSSGREVAKQKKSVNAAADKLQVSSFQFQVSAPRLWDLETPNLYKAVIKLKKGRASVDIAEVRFGFRDIEWKPESGMWLNGENIKLRGVCNHQDAGALGAAVPDKILRFRIEQLKAMGCNAIRTAHNPQTPAFYDLCDEIGMLVMDEVFDGWKKKAAHDYGRYYFNAWWRRDLTDWIKRDRNHPSVVIWSVGNETGGAVGRNIVERCHALDPTRPVTSGHSGSEWMDVFGVNGGSERVGWFDDLKKDRVFVGTENPHTWQVRGFYRTQTWYRDGMKSSVHAIPDLTDVEVFSDDWTDAAGRANRKQVFNSSYDNATVRINSRQSIEQLRDIPNYAGSFRWTGYDYIGEASYVHGGWPFRAFMGGAIDLANFEKDLYYLYQSQWTDQPMVHLLPHWTHPTIKEGTLIPVWVYSNCETVELFHNGKSLGRQMPGRAWEKMQCQWMVPWKPGALRAVGRSGGRTVAEQVVRTAGAPAKNVLSVDGSPLAEEGRDMVQVRVSAADAAGIFYPYGENRTFFRLIGPARIRALDNGSPVDVEPHFGVNSRRAFYGLTRAYVEATGEPGSIALVAGCIHGEKKQVTSNMVSIDTQLLALRGAPPDPEIKTFYTTDGSDPTPQSTPYTGAFPVKPGTTVKALVVVDGKPFQTLEERFAPDEGFVWNSRPVAANPGGEQAEDAALSGARVRSKGSGFHGRGFIDFGHNQGAYAEWYQENDGGARTAKLVIRYSGKRPGKPGRYIRVAVNGTVIQDRLLLPNTADWGSDWKTVTLPVRIGRGANTIRLTTVESGGMYIDEISVK